MKALSVATYAALRKKVEETLLLGQQRIEEAKIRTYWETGRLIHRHILQNKERAGYGEKIIEKLSGDLQIGSLVLWRCLKFARTFPILSARKELTWAHYRALIAVPDEKKRLALADQASKGEWSSRDLEIEVRNILWDERSRTSDGKALSLLPVPVPGPFFTYKIIKPETINSKSNELLIDLGFSTVLELNRVSDVSMKPDTIVTSGKDSRGRYSLSPCPRPGLGHGEELLYTYQAFVERVIDGDTLKVEIDLGFNTRIRQSIRLRAIDCPELDTPEGQAAKRFVERELVLCEFITIKSTQTRKEKWGRYLGDVFYNGKAGQQPYLNNILLEKGMAVRVRE